MNLPKIENMCSPRSGREVANQFSIRYDGKRMFQSYSTRIALVENGKVYLDPQWDYSVTTLKYLKEFLNQPGSKKDIQDKIESGFYSVVNLNGID